MRASRTTGRLAAVLLSLSSVASAWPKWIPEIDALVVRQDTTAPPAATQTNTGTPPRTTNLNTGAQRTGTDTSGATITPTGSQSSGTGTGGSNLNRTQTRTTFNAEDAAGSVVMITPAATAGTQLYKVGDYVTWGWNYTNLQGPPTAIDVLVSCSVATRTWTLTQNMTFATKAEFIWDTGKDNSATPLVVEEYTLLVHDSDSAATGTVDPGYLAPFAGFTFGVYTKAPYTPLASGWQCVSCSGAISDMVDRRALGFAMAMSAVTVLTFTWFVTGLGIVL